MSRQTPEYYREDLKHNWTRNTYSCVYTDQFGFTIHWSDKGYTLEYKEQLVYCFKNLEGAKEAARVILNDAINQPSKDIYSKISRRQRTRPSSQRQRPPAQYSNTTPFGIAKE